MSSDRSKSGAGRATAWDWTRSVPASAAMISTMLSFELPLRVAAKVGGQDSMVDLAHTFVRVMWRAMSLTGATLEVSGREHVDPATRYLIVANHQGFSDVVVLSKVFEDIQPRYVAKRELAHGWPSISYVLQASGSAVIDRHKPAEAIVELERLGREAKDQGWSVVIFPEGTRAKDGVARRWKARGVATLLETTGPCAVLPVTLAGGSDLFAHNGVPFKADVRMRCHVHPPVEPPGPDDDFGEWLEGIRQTVAAAL